MESYENRIVIERQKDNVFIKYLTDNGYYQIIHKEYWLNIKLGNPCNLSDREIIDIYKLKIESYLKKKH